MALAPVSLDDKYALESGRVFLTGTQALVRLPMMQRRRDEAAGLNTGCFISGYRGSPLGLVDQQLWQAKAFLENHHIRFQPGVNEDLAATAILGTQQLDMSIGANYDGVFSMWYAKGPGVDRSGDILRHGNLFGSSPTGGVLLLAGDDHTCKSSTTAHQTEYAFMDAMIPVLNPAGVQEFLDLGLYGWAMSRYSGCWTAFKLIAETVDSSASVYVDPHRVDIRRPDDFAMPEGGLSIRYPDTPLEMEERLHRYKINAVLAFARANKLDKAVLDGPNRRFGIVTCGKSYLDVRQALEELGINEDYARAIGLSIYKVGMTWPLEREGIRQFCEGLEEVLVVEEKRALIENQLKEQLYNWRADRRPRVIGKFDEAGEWILPSIGELTPTQIARVIAKRLTQFHTSRQLDDRVKYLESQEQAVQSNAEGFQRTPYFCSGCPHNSSTKVPDGSRALSGIGCHFMAQWMERNTATFTHMGAEGVPWVGISPFTDEEHVFANIGDGTYYHSGLMAIRQSIAAGVNMTYKILFNDAVAMTGGQPHDGPLTVPRITQQMMAEGATRVVVVTDEPDKYPSDAGFAKGTKIFHRDDLMKVQKELRTEKGVTVLVYDQTCAAEKRRRRRRGTFPDPLKRVMINDLVCEGCGDCSVKSNCLSVVPKETEFGRKRTIDQSSCNKDYSCVNGFCPSFVTVHGTDLKKPRTSGKEISVPDIFEALPEPVLPGTAEPFGMLVTGIGGTGVVTIGAIVAMAAHIEGKGCSVLDMVGLAQKGGAVLTHIRIADRPEDLHAVRIAAGGADMMLGCDIVTAAGFDALSKVAPGTTRAVVNSHETITGDFTRDPDMSFPGDELHQTIAKVVGSDRTDFLEATKLATELLGNSIASNMFMLGCAWQKGLVPVSREALFQAIELNGVAVEANKQAFTWGRRAAHDLALVRKMASSDEDVGIDEPKQADTLVSHVERRVDFLTGYQGRALARRYKDFVVKVQTSEAHRVQGAEALTLAVARYYFKLLAYKDEYEVARLHTETDFLAEVGDKFEPGYKLKFHLAPPMFARRDPDTGVPRKMEVGEWVLPAFRTLARLKILRGTPLDAFGYTQERKRERQLIKEYEATIESLLRDLTPANHGVAVEIASLPEQIRGYGHIKEKSISEAKAREIELLAEFRNPQAKSDVAAE
jgi:indolepyruvate ferredoxin oxidoreductase